MKKIIISIIIILLIALGIGLFLSLRQLSAPTPTPTAQSGTLPGVGQNSSTVEGVDMSNLSDYIGQTSQVYPNAPTSTSLSIGTLNGIVEVKNFYLSNPPVIDGGYIVIESNGNYGISYDPSSGNFWIGIYSTPFATWQGPAERDFLQVLGISETDACKLSVGEGVIYSVNNPDDGMSFPLSFCANSAFQTSPAQ